MSAYEENRHQRLRRRRETFMIQIVEAIVKAGRRHDPLS